MINPFSTRLDRVRYEINDAGAHFRILQISDLHDEFYGENNSELLSAVCEEAPDIIVFTGDLTEPSSDRASMKQLLSFCAERCPSYYVAGNHEMLGNASNIKSVVRETGTTVLEGSAERITVGGRAVDIYGMDSYYTRLLCDEKQLEPWEDQLKRCLCEKEKRQNDGAFSLLLFHRPDFIRQFEEWSYDLVLSGHAHGGQFRLPGIINGLYAPNQGIFPRYAGGYYMLKNTRLIVSRGLCRKRFPRIFNRPEVVVIDIGVCDNKITDKKKEKQI